MDTWSQARRRACARAEWGCARALAAARPETGHSEACLAARGESGQRRQHRLRPAGEALVGPGLEPRHELGHPAVVAEAAVVGGHDVLDLVGQHELEG